MKSLDVGEGVALGEPFGLLDRGDNAPLTCGFGGWILRRQRW